MSKVTGPPAANVIKARMKSLNEEAERLRDAVVEADKMKLREAERRAEVEREVSEERKKVAAVEEERAEVERRLKEMTETLEVISKEAHKSERNRKVMENRQNADYDRMDQLEQQIKSSLLATDEANKRYEELIKKVSTSEQLLEKAEGRCSMGEKRIKELEGDLKMIATKLKSLEIQKDQAIEREINYENRIHCLTLQVKEAGERSITAEREVTKREQEINSLKDQMDREKNNYFYIKKELEKLHEGYFGL